MSQQLSSIGQKVIGDVHAFFLFCPMLDSCCDIYLIGTIRVGWLWLTTSLLFTPRSLALLEALVVLEHKGEPVESATAKMLIKRINDGSLLLARQTPALRRGLNNRYKSFLPVVVQGCGI